MMSWPKLLVVPACSLALAATACGGARSGTVPVVPEENVATSSASSTPTVTTTSSAGPASPTTAAKPTASARPPEVAASQFDPERFTTPTRMTNPYFPMKPWTQWVWKGHAYDDGDRVTRKITMTVTDLTKVVNGVRTVVGYDQDATAGETEEVELTFYAQDDDGAVWYFGEYSEEYDGAKIVKSPTWLGGLRQARPGIMMQPAPRTGTPGYEEGWGGSEVDWTDRGKVDQVGVKDCVPTGCYQDVVVIDEYNPDEPGTHQLKSYAPGIGGIRTGWRGAKEVEQEELELVSRRRLSPDQQDDVRSAVLAEEKRAYQRSPQVYGRTAPMTARSS